MQCNNLNGLQRYTNTTCESKKNVYKTNNDLQKTSINRKISSKQITVHNIYRYGTCIPFEYRKHSRPFEHNQSLPFPLSKAMKNASNPSAASSASPSSSSWWGISTGVLERNRLKSQRYRIFGFSHRSFRYGS